MDSDEAEIDYFSSLIIHQSNSPTENEIHVASEIQSRQKLKPRRKEKEVTESSISPPESNCGIVNGNIPTNGVEIIEAFDGEKAAGGGFGGSNSWNQYVQRATCTVASRFKITVKYGGLFRLINNGTKKKYCFGRQRTIYLDRLNFGFVELFEEVSGLYPFDENQNLSLFFLDKRVASQSFIQLEDDKGYELMLEMYDEKKEVVVYMTKEMIPVCEDRVIEEDGNVENIYEEDSDYCNSEASHHSCYSDTEEEDDDGHDFLYEGEFYSYDMDDPKIEVGAKFPHVVAFRRALNHHAITNDFEYNLVKSEPTRVTATCGDHKCNWRVHAAVSEDEITFVVRTMQSAHKCCGVNKRGNKHATQGWIADRVINDVKKDPNVSPNCLKKKLEEKYGLSLPYSRVWEGKELALREIYGKWPDSFNQIGALEEEILMRNPGTVVEIGTELIKGKNGENVHFQRFFISLGACISGFLNGCRPYVSLDACHLKGKWKGVIASATAIDGNNWMFPVAFAVMEGENEKSWEWFLRALYKAIEMPHGLVISADMQKGLQNALAKVYPLAEHRECMRHLFSNFKKHFPGDLLKFGLWGAARTYSPTRYKAIIDEINALCPAAIAYLRDEHYQLWSRSQFGTDAKCDNITNNIAETFNSWITQERNKPVIDLLDSIRQKLMEKFDKRRAISAAWKGPLVPKVADYITNISRGLGGYDVHRSANSCAEIQKDGLRWVVNLETHTCTCRAWQVRGIPCIHAAALIASIRNVKWENYVDPYFTVARFKTTYASGIAPMPSRNEWVSRDLGYIMHPPILNRPPGRPRKNRLKPSDEPKKRSYKCARCGTCGHNKRKCKNAVRLQENEGVSHVTITDEDTTKRSRVKGRIKSKKRACPPSIFKLLQEDKL